MSPGSPKNTVLRELAIFLCLLFAGLVLVPIAIYWIGPRLLGDFGGYGFADFFGSLSARLRGGEREMSARAGGRRRLDAEAYPLMVQRFVALAHPPTASVERVPLPRLAADPDNRQALCERLGLDSSVPTVVVCPGAEYGPAKRWPAEHFAEVAQHVLAEGRQVWLAGSAGDASVAEEIAAAAPGVVNLCGRTSLVDAVDLLSLASHVVCNDSGLMHVAGALRRSVIAIFGSTSPSFTPPLGESAVVVREPQPCSPCFERECPLGHLRCLRELSPAKVIEAL